MKSGNFASLGAGTLFGLGLTISGMTDPDNVLAFLTLNADWDPALIFVMGSALMVTMAGYRMLGVLLRSRGRPLFDSRFHMPSNTDVDARLIGGATLFGLGWGLAGYCPGPALVGLMTLDPRALVFIAAYVGGVLAYEMIQHKPAGNVNPADG